MPKFVPRQRKHKVIARRQTAQDVPSDPNAAEIRPTERDARREDLRAEVRAQQSQPNISSKKRKRLDHYVETKLKKEENLELIKKLAASKVDTSLFRSAKKLGRGSDSQRERMERALSERARGINIQESEEILFEQRPEIEGRGLGAEEIAISSAFPAGVRPQPAAPSFFGTGLKRPLEVDEEGKPVIKKRKRRKAVKAPVVIEPQLSSRSDSEMDSEMESEMESDRDSKLESESEWEGFSTQGDTPDKSIIVTVDGDGQSAEDEDDDGTNSSASESEEAEDSEDDDASSSTSSAPDTRARSSAFKAWADQQRNAALGFTPSNTIEDQQSQGTFLKSGPHRNAPVEETISAPLAPLDMENIKPVASVSVPRSEEVQEARLKLPVVQEEQKIMESIQNNPVTVVWGATGSGKTTQVPQMMFENGYGSNIGNLSADKSVRDKTKGMIGVTQPRRVAAVSVAERVGTEMGEMKKRVGHQVRFDTSVSSATAIKFMTDGILLREIANDFTLSKYSSIVIDEAHERSVNTDILIGLMSRIVDLRAQLAKEKPNEFYPIKLVIMSATLRIEDFTKNATLFRAGPPPIVQAEGRQYPVVEHFARRTRRDYLDETFQKVSRGHKNLPAGGMLVFLTGQGEINALAKRLQQAFAPGSGSQYKNSSQTTESKSMPLEADDLDGPADYDPHGDDSGDDSDEIHGLDDDEDRDFLIEGETAAGSLKMHVLPLYSQLPTKQQMRVFDAPPECSRLIVLATNVAETSLTIPGIRYVFDCGRSKEKHYQASTGVQTFEVGWISKASAAQRAGRAGRTGPGHCYRLYSSAVYERDFDEYAVPEILRSPVENVALMVKNVDFPNVANFPFPTPPDRHALANAENLLKYLGAVNVAGKITDVGRALAAYPLSPRFGRMLLLAQSHSLTAHTIALVAALAVPELFTPETQLQLKDDQPSGKDDGSDSEDQDYRRPEVDYVAVAATEQRRKAYNRARGLLTRWDDRSDAMKLLMAFALCSAPGKLTARCEEFFIREKGMSEALELRSQLVRIVRSQATSVPDSDLLSLPPLGDAERGKLKFILAAGFVDQVAIRADLLRDSGETSKLRKPRRAIEVPYVTLFPSHEVDKIATAEEQEMQKYVFAHASSVLAHLSIPEMPSYVLYSHLSRATSATINSSKILRTRMHPLGTVSARQLVALADGTPLLEVGKPIGKIETLPRAEGRERRSCWVGLSLKGKADTRWPVGTRKEMQFRKGGEWVTEKVVG